MALGKYLIPKNKKKQSVGLSGAFTNLKAKSFRVEDINENFEVSHDAASLGVDVVAYSLGAVAGIIKGFISVGILTSGGTLGISALVAGAAAGMLYILNKIGLFDDCNGATYTPDVTTERNTIISDAIKNNYANISNQISTCVLQDEKVVSEMNNLLRKLACYRTFYRQESLVRWKSECSAKNVENINDFIDKLEGNLLAKIRKLEFVYEIDIWKEEIDFSNGAGKEIATEECKIYHNLGKGTRFVVYLSRKKGEEETLVPFVDFARSDLTTLEVVNGLLKEDGIEGLREKGKEINSQWLRKGCVDIYTNGNVICKKINADDIARQNIATQDPKITVVEDLATVIEKYYNNDLAYPLEKVIEIVQKHNDAQIRDAFDTNSFNYARFGQKKEFVCWLALQRATAFAYVKSLFLYKSAKTTAQRTEITKIIDSICVGYTPAGGNNGQGANTTPSVPNTPAVGNNGQSTNTTPANPKNPAQGTTTPSVPYTPAGGNNGQGANTTPANPKNPAQGTTTPSVPNTPAGGSNGNTPLIDNQQKNTNTPNIPAINDKKSRNWWWFLLVALGVYVVSRDDKNKKNTQ